MQKSNYRMALPALFAAAALAFAAGLAATHLVRQSKWLESGDKQPPGALVMATAAGAGGTHSYSRRGDILIDGKKSKYSYFQYYDDDSMDGALEILDEGRVAYTIPVYTPPGDLVEGPANSEGDGARSKGKPLRAADITGDGVPDLIVHQPTGGMHICCDAYVLSLRGGVKEVARFESLFEPVEFKDVDGDGKYEVVTKDWSLARDEGGWTGYPAATVVLEFDGKGYKFSARLMRKPAPKDFEGRLARFEKEVRQTGRPSDKMLDMAVRLIYSGQGDLALSMFDRAFPDGAGIDDTDYILNGLAQSEYWEDVKKLNGWDGAAGEEKLRPYYMGC